MDCKEAQVLSIPHIMGYLDCDAKRRQELEAHLLSCQVCAGEYESSRWVVGFIQDHKAEFTEALESLEIKATEQKQLEYSWQCIEAKLDKIEAREKQAQLYRSLWKATAAAACVVIGISAWLMLLDSKTFEKPTQQQIALAPAPSVEIELLSDNGNIAIVPEGVPTPTAITLPISLFVHE